MPSCPYCGAHRGRGDGQCSTCTHLDYRYVDEDDLPIPPEEIRWSDDGGYVLPTTATWSKWDYVALEDPDGSVATPADAPVDHEDGWLAPLRRLFR